MRTLSLHDPKLDVGLRTFFGMIYIIAGVISFFGLIGSLFSHRQSVRIFSTLLWFLLICYITISIVQEVEMFAHKDDHIDDCIGNITDRSTLELERLNNSTSNTVDLNNLTNSTNEKVGQTIQKNSPEYCQRVVTIQLWFLVVWYSIIALAMLYFCSVAARFARQLESEYRHEKIREHAYGTRSAVNRASTSRVSVANVGSLGYNPIGKGKNSRQQISGE
ncbi:hypothetical protein G9A89_023217 [Geosiphon pyriformis]|nr:hypothetical protein G9A89_023217 [Geosiphon pyriformis]